MGTRVNGIKNNLSYIIVWLRVTFHWSETIHQITTYLGSTRPLPDGLTCFMDPWQALAARETTAAMETMISSSTGWMLGDSGRLCRWHSSPPKKRSDHKVFLLEWKWENLHHWSSSRSYRVLVTTHGQLSQDSHFWGKVKLQNPIMTGNDPRILFKRPWRSAETEEKPEMDNCFYKAFTELQELIFSPLPSTCL